MGTAEAAEVIPSGVYRIDLGNDWFYLGSACNLKRREAVHRSTLRTGNHFNRVAQRVFDKYGEYSFTVLGRYPANEIIEQEQILLDKHGVDPKCANIAPMAGNCQGVKHTDDTKRKVSLAGRGKKTSPETRAKMSASAIGKKKSPEHRAAMMGRKCSAETRAKMSATLKGRTISPEWRQKIAAGNTGRKHSDETKTKISAAKTKYWARVREAAAAAL